MVHLFSTRFNDMTWEENVYYRKKHNIKCIYGTPLEFPPRICIDANIFVFEMNNSKNKRDLGRFTNIITSFQKSLFLTPGWIKSPLLYQLG